LGFEPRLFTDCGPWSEAQKNLIERRREALSEQSWSVIEASGMTVYDIRSKARAYKRRQGQLDIIVIDYIGQIRPVGKSTTREREMAEISATLKETAKELDCCLIAVSQLNRDLQYEPLTSVNDKSKRRLPLPRMSHLKDSGAIEADANVVLLPFLPYEYLKERLGEEHEWSQEWKGTDLGMIKAMIRVGKNKLGPKGTVDCHFHTKRMVFFTPVPGRQPDLIDEMMGDVE
jgi:replicative DNA helicase